VVVTAATGNECKPQQALPGGCDISNNHCAQGQGWDSWRMLLRKTGKSERALSWAVRCVGHKLCFSIFFLNLGSTEKAA
jgi:hypothetical protein